MDSVDQFAAEASRFERWAHGSTAQGAGAVREALIGLTRLYLAGLELPPAWKDELADKPNAKRVGEEEYGEVISACARLPFDTYGEVFDPLIDPPEEPVIASISDDIGDIYRDVITGLREYEAGRRAQAVWEWGFGLQHHWGEHATGAIRAFHCWLAANAFDRLGAEAEPDVPPDRRPSS